MNPSIKYEIELISSLLSHPAGFEINLFNTIKIRKNSEFWYTVEWQQFYNPHANPKSEWETLEFYHLDDAAECFVELRHETFVGLDLEEKNPDLGKNYYYLLNDSVGFMKKYKLRKQPK